MSAISSWVISIAGICLLSVLMDLIMPDGKMGSCIKSVFSYAIALVVILPLPNVFKNEFSIDDIFSETDFEIQDSYIYNVNQARLDKWTECINDDLTNQGIYGVVVSISANIFEVNMVVDAVYVDLYNVVISDENKNINIKTEVVGVVLKYLEISKDKVVFYEWQKRKIVVLG